MKKKAATSTVKTNFNIHDHSSISSLLNKSVNSTTNKIISSFHPIKDYKDYINQLETFIESQNLSIETLKHENLQLKERCAVLENEMLSNQTTLQESVEIVEILQTKVSYVTINKFLVS